MRRPLPTPTPFELELLVKSHGWYDLPPWRWEGGRLARPMTVAGQVHDVVVSEGADTLVLEVRGPGRMGARRFAAVQAAVARSLGLEEDLTDFHARARSDPRLAWVAARGGGRLLRSPCLFEDAVKILTTVNMSWAGSRGMVSRLVEALGEVGPSGHRDFPTASAIAQAPSDHLRETVRAGFRAPWIAGLAEAVSTGALELEALRGMPEPEARKVVSSLKGFGPYATDLLLRLAGHPEGLALDSWCMARLQETRGRGRPPTPKTVARWFRPWGRWAGLALWCELTAPWHGE